MDKKTLEVFAREVAKGLKTEKDLAEFRQILTKMTVEAVLNYLDSQKTFRLSRFK